MTEPWRWTKGLKLTPQEYVRLGQLLAVSDKLVDGLAGDDIGLANDGATTARETGAEQAGSSGYGLAGGDDDDDGPWHDAMRVIDMSAATEAQRANENDATRDQDRLGRERGHRPSTQDRLDRALARIGTGTYDFASPSSAASTLARHRWDQAQADPVAAVIPGYPCGHIDETGRCGARYHETGCSGLADPELVNSEQMRVAMAQIASRPFLDSGGRAWADQHGELMGLGAHTEALTGVRRTDSLFEGGPGGRGELAAPQRQGRFGDPSDPDDAGTDVARSTRAAAGRVLAQMGLTPTDLARQRQQVAADPRRIADQRRRAVRPGDGSESARDRAERLRQPVTPASLRLIEEPDDGLRGAQPMFTRG